VTARKLIGGIAAMRAMSRAPGWSRRRSGSGLRSGHPEEARRGEVEEVLEGVDAVVEEGGVVERREVRAPHHRDERQPADDRERERRHEATVEEWQQVARSDVR